MTRFFKFPLIRVLASLKLSIALLVIFAVAIGKATFLESSYGAIGARALVYGTRWFELVLVLLCLNLLLVLFKNLPYRPRQTGFVLVHISMIWILISAGITRYFGHEGVMPIREGSSTDFIWSRETYLQLESGGETAKFPVQLYAPGKQDIAHTVKLGGQKYRLSVQEYWPHFSHTYQPADTGPAALKMTTVGESGPEALVLVAGKPQRVAGTTLQLVEGEPGSGGAGLVFTRAPDGAVTARPSQPMQRMDMASGEIEAELPAGENFPVEELELYRVVGGGFQFVLQEVIPHIQLKPAPSQDEHDPAAARIAVTGPQGVATETVVYKDDGRGEEIDLGGRPARVALGSVKMPLPYSLHLDDFLLVNYPGSRNPASYESHVRLIDQEKGINGRPVRIYMNNPLTHRGRKHFQSSYDTDERGTVLSVNYDPGKWPTYLGYILISLGFVLIFARDLIWPQKSEADDTRRTR
ncbi:MAG: cytochrome c biogenesis protein ResB [Candidatus Latescibacteria bacterium]|nr:cytochrome c biogenesis protein ResB [Candidatus Latescibacterota bacterium]